MATIAAMKYRRPLEPHGPAGTAALPQSAPVIEEFTGVDLVPATGRTDRWLLLAVVLGTLVLGFGFAGRVGGSPSVGPASAASSSAPSAAPDAAPTRAPVVGLTGPSQAGEDPTIAGSISVSLHPSATTGPTRGEAGLLVDGYAPSGVESVIVDVRTASGVLFASTVVQNALDDERSGSDGRPREGMGRLHRLFFVPGPIPADGWQVEITWRQWLPAR